MVAESSEPMTQLGEPARPVPCPACSERRERRAQRRRKLRTGARWLAVTLAGLSIAGSIVTLIFRMPEYSLALTGLAAATIAAVVALSDKGSK